MRNLILLLCLTALACVPAMAGKNASGALVVHTDDAIGHSWDPIDYCEIFPYQGEYCEGLNPTSSFVDPDFLYPAIVFYVAAFLPGSYPGVTVIFFGHDHDFAPGFISGWSFCGPPNSLEVPDTGWPNDVNAGNSLALGSPVVGDRLFPFYWLGVYGDLGNFIGPRINPTGGYAAFVSDDEPGVLDEIFFFGTMGWFGEGENNCPIADPGGACCFADGSCSYLTETDCYAQGGREWLGFDVCDPNPCPPVANEETTWGQIKADYE